MIDSITKLGSSGMIDLGVSKKTGVGRRKGVDRNGINTGIIGIAHSLFIARNKISSYPLFRIALSVMVTVSMISQIRGTKTMIDVSTDRLGEEHQFTIGWGVGSVCMTGLGNMSVLSPGIRRN